MINLVQTLLLLAEESSKYIAAALPMIVGIGAALAMGMAVSKGVEAVARQPEAQGKIMSLLMIGLAFIETTAIYALFISIMILVL